MGRGSGEIALESKVQLLQWIFEEKEMLFGKFSTTVDKELKDKTWKKIFEKCKATGITWVVGHDWKYFHDTVWQNLKR